MGPRERNWLSCTKLSQRIESTQKESFKETKKNNAQLSKEIEDVVQKLVESNPLQLLTAGYGTFRKKKSLLVGDLEDVKQTVGNISLGSFLRSTLISPTMTLATCLNGYHLTPFDCNMLG